MSSAPGSDSFHVDRLAVRIFDDRVALGDTAAADAAKIIAAAVQRRGSARIMVGTGNSQVDVISSLVDHSELDWTSVEAFHLDEYVGISPEHPASFRRWLRTRLVDKVRPGRIHYLKGDAPNVDAEAGRYAAALALDRVDLAFVGIGENGHIAFNDPPVADFSDPLGVKRVTLDEACRRQQVGEGHFPNLASVPSEALTVTCSGLLRAEHWICCVPERRKAQAVKDTLEGPIGTQCPGSVARTHPDARLYLDRNSASLLRPGR